MKKSTLYLLSAVAVLLLTGCTRNHGDIGIWFGTWHVESITCDGEPVTVAGDYFFQFQSRVIRVSHVGGYEQTVESYGTWSDDGDGKLTITFPDPDVFYIVMPALETHNDFTVTGPSGGQITLTKTTGDGVRCIYRLQKQP